MPAWPMLYGSAVVFSSAESVKPVRWALHACCHGEWRGKQPLCFSFQKHTLLQKDASATLCCECNLPFKQQKDFKWREDRWPAEQRAFLSTAAVNACLFLCPCICDNAISKETESKATEPEILKPIMLLMSLKCPSTLKVDFSASQRNLSWTI